MGTARLLKQTYKDKIKENKYIFKRLFLIFAKSFLQIALLFIDRQYYHKWAVLTDPTDLTAGPKGYVKCNILVNVKDERVKVHPETEGEEDIEGYVSFNFYN